MKLQTNSDNIKTMNSMQQHASTKTVIHSEGMQQTVQEYSNDNAMSKFFDDLFDSLCEK